MSESAKHVSGTLPPNATIGIIGGGQLGRMLAASAAQLGYRTIVLEPGAEPPAAQLCNRHIAADYDDEDALSELARCCDVITYEFENVPMKSAHYLAPLAPLYPPPRALEVSQDRLLEKQTLTAMGIDVAPFVAVETLAELQAGLDQLGGGVLKTRRFGYDGKGQKVIDPGSQVDDGILATVGKGPFVLEQRIRFDAEFSVIAARARDGTCGAFDPADNTHVGGILDRSRVPSHLPKVICAKAAAMAEKLLHELDYVGTIGVEFFHVDGEILVNEFAPRVHNSGHWTVEACQHSQFDQHIRAIAGLPLASFSRHHDCEMINLVGTDEVGEWLTHSGASLTLYGKAQVRPGRKMGHVTLIEP